MRIVRFRHQGEERHGVLRDDVIQPITGSIFDAVEASSDNSAETIPRASVKLLAPIQPGKLVCVGLNYVLHAKESGVPMPDEPMLFMCSPQAIIGPDDVIVLDNANDRIDYEAEIAIVVGKRARNVRAANAAQYILGYTCANDVSNRDLQRKDGQFTRAKSFDTYKPLGPWIETELDPDIQEIRLSQNGDVKQSSNTSDMIFSTRYIFEFISGIMTLEPGDVIITGTPSGVGPMKSGDRIEVEIAGIGRLSNAVA
jgi:2-keto-4-pentenoate hydratase/2-oxohepta-3-ene-1,7-dioic acid hydratase in catechol pathway